MSVAQAEQPVPRLRLLPTPQADPPYDDEVPAEQRRVHTAPVRLALLGLRDLPRRQLPDDLPEGPTPLDTLPPPAGASRRLLQALLEVLAGVRPLAQLSRDLTPELYARLERLVTARPRSAGTRPDSRAVRSVHVQARPEGVAEVCATVLHPSGGGRVVALALRLDGVDGRWQCSQIEGLRLTGP